MGETKHIFCLITILLLGCCFTEASAQQTLYGADGVSNLYTINPADGSTTLIGPMGIDSISAMDFDPITGVLYAGTGGSSSNPSNIYVVDHLTGSATLLGPTLHGSDFAIP